MAGSTNHVSCGRPGCRHTDVPLLLLYLLSADRRRHAPPSDHLWCRHLPRHCHSPRCNDLPVCGSLCTVLVSAQPLVPTACSSGSAIQARPAAFDSSRSEHHYGMLCGSQLALHSLSGVLASMAQIQCVQCCQHHDGVVPCHVPSCHSCRGPLGWLVPTEVQPLETRTAGTAVNTIVNFAFTFVIGQVFLSMLCGLEWGVFLFFAGEYYSLLVTVWESL